MQIHTKYKPRKKVLAPSTIPKVEDVIARNIAISFIADHCKPSYELRRPFRNKVSGQVRTAVLSGVLTEAAGGFVFGEIMGWAKDKPEWAEGLAPFPTAISAKLNASLPSIIGNFDGHSLPATLDACHSRIVELETCLTALKEKIDGQRRFTEVGLKMTRPKKKL